MSKKARQIWRMSKQATNAVLMHDQALPIGTMLDFGLYSVDGVLYVKADDVVFALRDYALRLNVLDAWAAEAITAMADYIERLREQGPPQVNT